MRHHIIAKFNSSVTDREAAIREIREIFVPAMTVEGVRGVSVHPNVIPRDNRYDVMIVLHMDRDALTTWDDCAIHHEWKKRFGSRLEKKAIFDCDD